MRTLHGHGIHVATAAYGAVLLLAGCSASATSGTDPTPTTSPPPATGTTSSPTMSPSPDPTTALDAAVLAAYDGFWQAQVATLNHPVRKPDPNLIKFAIDKALADIRATVLIYRHSGIEMHGQPVRDAKISSWSRAPDPSATATITDCVDSTDWQPVYVKTGKSAAAPGQEPRVIVESNVERYDGSWVVRTSVAHRDRSC